MGKPNNSIGHVKLPGESVQRPIVPQQLWDGTTNYAASLPTLTEDSKILLSAVSVTYAQLGTLMNNNQLLAGAFYRITDFVTTTAQARTRSAGHQFDLIVHAISNNELSEDANAVLHAGDTYFANSNLKAWVIKYSYANNTSRYGWADTTNGKGVIYYMKDEFFNECGYDFKNIQFARYKVTACANCTGLINKYIGVIGLDDNPILTNYMTIDTTDYRYCYTFDCCQQDYSLNSLTTTYVRPDGSTFNPGQIQCTKCYIAPHEDDKSNFWLNNIVNLLESSRDCMFRIVGFPLNATLLGGASAFDANSIVDCIVGSWGSASYIDGYIAQTSTVHYLYNSLICCTGTSQAFMASRVTRVFSSCIIGGVNGCFYACTVDSIQNCTLIAGAANIIQSYLQFMADCNISARTGIICYCNLAEVMQCSASDITYFCYACSGNHLRRVTKTGDALSSTFIYASDWNYISDVSFYRVYGCKMTYLTDSAFNYIRTCSFTLNQYITCTQNLAGCNFNSLVSNLNISSTDTTQTISNTNFHDIAGASSSEIKNLVIPEDYSQTHTVEIYSSNQYVIHEID